MAAASGTNPPPAPDSRIQFGGSSADLQSGTAAANLQIGGGGRDIQRGNAWSDVQLPDASRAGLCSVRGQVFREMVVISSGGFGRTFGYSFVIRITNDALKLIDASTVGTCDDEEKPMFPYRAPTAAAAAAVDDRLSGGAGNDLQFAGRGNDTLDGGTARTP